jgi:hypothetical protein
LLCTFIPLVALAMLRLGVPMPAELLDDWFSDGQELPPSDELAA